LRCHSNAMGAEPTMPELILAPVAGDDQIIPAVRLNKVHYDAIMADETWVQTAPTTPDSSRASMPATPASTIPVAQGTPAQHGDAEQAECEDAEGEQPEEKKTEGEQAEEKKTEGEQAEEKKTESKHTAATSSESPAAAAGKAKAPRKAQKKNKGKTARATAATKHDYKPNEYGEVMTSKGEEAVDAGGSQQTEKKTKKVKKSKRKASEQATSKPKKHKLGDEEEVEAKVAAELAEDEEEDEEAATAMIQLPPQIEDTVVCKRCMQPMMEANVRVTGKVNGRWRCHKCNSRASQIARLANYKTFMRDTFSNMNEDERVTSGTASRRTAPRRP
jgi:hypothetical protein